MLPERREFASKSLRGFITSPNPEVHDLEEVLGIKFTTPPARVDLTRRNRLVFLGREHALPYIVEGTRNAFYDRRYNAFFTRTGIEDRYTAWHENMHGYVDSTSEPEAPVLYQAMDLVRERILGKEIDPMEMERFATAAAFSEGVADWATVTTAREIGTKEEYDHANRNHNAYTETYEGHSVIHGARSLLEEEVFKASSALIVPDKFTLIDNMRGALIEIVKITYYVGYSFMVEAMDTLRARGFSVASAIDYLIANPPTTLKQIEYPTRHVELKLKNKATKIS